MSEIRGPRQDLIDRNNMAAQTSPAMRGKSISEAMKEIVMENPESAAKAFNQVIGENIATETAIRRERDAERVRGERLAARVAELEAALGLIADTGSWFINPETNAETWIVGCHPRCTAVEALQPLGDREGNDA